MAQANIFKILTDEEYARMFKTFIRNSSQNMLVRNEVIQSLVDNYSDGPFDLMSIGAGVGWLEDEIIKHPSLKVKTILAIEPNPEHAEKLEEKSNEWIDTQCNIDTSYFDDSYETAMKFDVVLLVHSIYYTKSPINTIIKAKSFLKPGGQVLIVLRGERGGLELAACLHKQVKIDPSICTYNWEGSVQLIEELKRNGIKYQIQNFTDLHDVTDFIERNNTPTSSDTVSFLLHTKYEDLNTELQDEIYKVVRSRITVGKGNRKMFNHVNSFICVGNT